MSTLNWGIIGCGVIAKEMAQAMREEGRMFYGVCNRTYEKSVAFAKEYKISNVYKTYDEMVADSEIDVIYIASPHNSHFPYIMKALECGKHVLCEKAITLNSIELEKAMASAKEKNLILAEGVTLYHLPLFKKLQEFVKSGALGELRGLQMNFGSYKEYDMTNRFYNPELAGGALLDIGVYALSFVRWFLSEKPNQVLSQMKKTPTGVDEQVSILLMNNMQEMATILMTLHAKQPKRGMAAYDKGYLEIYNYPRSTKAVITYTEDGRKEEFELGDETKALWYEIVDMEKAIQTGVNEMHLDYTKDVMDIMTSIRKEWGVVYPEEKNMNLK